MDIKDLLNKDSLTATLKAIQDDMDKDFDHFGPFIVIWNDGEGATHDRFFGSNAEIIGMLDIGREAHLNHIFATGEVGDIEDG